MAYGSRCLAVVAVLALVICSSPAPAEAISCRQALEYLMPCQSYLMGVADISSACCLGAQSLSRASATQADRKTVCRCLKQVALSVNVDKKRAEQLPQLCKIEVPVTIQPNIDCDTIPMGDLSFELKNSKFIDVEAFPAAPPGIEIDVFPPSTSPNN